MLQRSPTWMVARPSVDPTDLWLRRWLPQRAALFATRWKNVLFGLYIFQLARRDPQRLRQLLLGGVRRALGPEADIDTDFTPRYDPWRQRLCLVPDGDLFKAIVDGRAAVVTDRIKTFTEHGIELASGRTLPADIVVSATGLELAAFGNAELHVDGTRVDAAHAVNYRGVMIAGVPNFAYTFGYTNASWTLKADLTARFVCRLLNHMRATAARVCLPPAVGADVALLPAVDFSSGYFQRALDRLPKQGATAPWKLNQNYLRDIVALRFAKVDDGILRFAR
jgi:cation diffusion facilitator CzcD-associated flavoprotein CzcO